MDVSIKSAEWKTGKIEERSRIKVTENLVVVTGKKYNWLQRKMWKLLLNIDIEKV